MNNQKKIKLSSNWTNVDGGLLGGLFFSAFFIISIIRQNFNHGTIMAIQVFLFLFPLSITAFFINRLIFACDAKIIQDKLILTKQFRSSKSYTFDKIERISSSRSWNVKHITVKMRNDDNSLEKFVIINHRSFFSSKNRDPERILRELQMNF